MVNSKDPVILNAEIPNDVAEELTINIVEKLEVIIQKILDEFCNEGATFQIMYDKLKCSTLWTEQYIMLAPFFRTMNLDELTVNQKKAFFINVYNMLAIHRVLSVKEMPNSCNDIPAFWRSSAYVIAQKTFTLADIINGILRGNKPRPTSAVKQLDEYDFRMSLVDKKPDPRVLFALTTVCKSSPVLQVYMGLNIDEQLDKSTEKFLSRSTEVTVDVNRKEIVMSPIFQWYKSDFGGSDCLCLRWAKDYLDLNTKRLVESCIDAEGSDVYVNFSSFDWDLNIVTPSSPQSD